MRALVVLVVLVVAIFGIRCESGVDSLGETMNVKFDPEDPLNVATKEAHDAGMTMVFAAGNEGPGKDTLNPYSVAPWVIGVAAGEKDGETLADFSSPHGAEAGQ